MEHDPSPLPDDLATAQQLIRELAQTIRDQEQFIQKLQHQLEQLLRHRFGRKAEKIDPNQLLFFAREILAAASAEPPPSPPPADTPAAAPEGSSPRKNGHGRKPLPASLPRRRVVHDVPPEQLPCPECGTVRTRIGEEVREQLEYVPASMIVIQHVRPKYACAECQANITIAERMPEPIEKGLPGPGLMAQVITSKYADHLPLHRQEGIFRRFGVELPRQTTCDWMRIAAELLEPIWKEMLRRIKPSEVIQTDDTPVRVLDPGHAGSRQGRLWDYLGDRDHPYLVFDYTPDRSSAGPERILQGFRGYLQADAYSAYDGLYATAAIVEVGCWMHARRKFYEARTSDPERSHRALAWISLLYDVEREAKEKELNDAERQALRGARSRPILEEIGRWLEAERPRVLPKSPIGEAIGYAWNQWTALNRYLEAGSLEIDNGASERGLRPVAVGRVNWLFLGSDRGGRTAAILMSLCASCKRVGVDPLAYLRDVLERISTHPARRIEELLPDCWHALRQAEAAPPTK
jgi:transposase